MAVKTMTLYANVVNSQENPNDKNASLRYTWTNQPNAIIPTDQTYTWSHFNQIPKTVKTKKNGKTVSSTVLEKQHPWTLTAHDYRFDLPSTACINRIRFTARMRIAKGQGGDTKNVTVMHPTCRFNIYGKAYKEKTDNTKKFGTGWNDGYYFVEATTKMSTSWTDATYTMKKTDVDKGKFSVSDLEATVMGVDFIFDDAEWNHQKQAYIRVEVAWVKCEIQYYEPEYNITYDDLITTYELPTPSKKNPNILVTSKNAKSKKVPQSMVTGEPFQLIATFKNTTCGKGGSQVLDVALPWGTELQSATASSGSSFNSSTMKWTVNANGVKEYTLTMHLIPYVDKSSTLTIGNDSVGQFPYNYATYVDLSKGYSTLTWNFEDEVHQNHLACGLLGVEGYSSDDTSVTITFDNDKTYTIKNISLESGSSGVSLASANNNVATLTVPQDEDYTASLKFCYYPNVSGANKLTFTSSDSEHNPLVQDYEVLPPYNYIATVPSDNLYIYNHRIVSETQTEAMVLDCKSKDGDSLMIQGDCNIKMHYLEGLDYIGCVPLEQTHFEPVSTYKDKLLDSHYKNKRYMGKQLASDENISLNVRLHPKDVPTIQGLVDMDKPVPINANHKCFEGDPLNHRGWIELYGIKTIPTGNNPFWYKCEIDVKYLTHNLNSRFYIEKGNKIADYPFDDLLAEVYESGSSLSDEDTLFNVDTDGTYYYNDDDDADDNKRNVFTLDNNQHFHIISKNPLSSTTNISFEWFNTYFVEDRENQVERIISLIDKNGNAVFTYQYYDYMVEDDSIICNVKAYRNDDDIDLDKTIELRKGVDVLDSDEDVDEVYDEYYGSKIHLNLTGNVLELVDEGFNGKEITLKDIVLDEGEYKLDIQFKNRNDDNETDDLICFTDIVVQDSILKSQFDTKYPKMYVSPFPVANKKLLFTRDAEEGTIYYYDDDGGEYSYLIDPYYQYANGTDLKTSDGTSIFNLNYGYEIVYIQNGLVRLGFNRLNGNLYLGKYDVDSQEYVTTHRLHLQKYDDINVKSITDDKIEIQASDSIFSIWRGHPYIMIKHDDEDIDIDTVFTRIWAEKVGDNSTLEMPSYWDLMNNDNLLPSNIGGYKTLSTDNVEVEEVTHSDRNTSSLAWGTNPSSEDMLVDTDLIFELTGTTDNIQDEINVDGEYYDGYYGSYEITVECDNVPSEIYLDASKNPLQTSDVISISSKIVDSCRNSVGNQLIRFYKED